MTHKSFFSFLLLVFLGLGAFSAQSCGCNLFDDLGSSKNTRLTVEDKQRADQKRTHFFYGEFIENDKKIEVMNTLCFCCDTLENTNDLIAREIVITGRFLEVHGVYTHKGCQVINTGRFICNRLAINGIEVTPYMTLDHYSLATNIVKLFTKR